MTAGPPADRESVSTFGFRDRVTGSLAFGVVAIVGQLSALWPPGPSQPLYYWVSCGLLAASAFIAVFPRRQPPETWLVRAAVYIASVAFLMLATGGVSSGLGTLLFVPVVGVALYGRREESVVVVLAVLATLLGVSLSGPDLADATVRRTFLFGAIAGVLSIAIHGLRSSLVESNVQTRRLLYEAQAMNTAARQIASLRDPGSIAALGAQLAAELASPPGSEIRRALYVNVDGGVASIEAQFDDLGLAVEESWALDEHPALQRVVDTLEPARERIDTSHVTPQLRSVLQDIGVTHCAWVPVCPDGTLHGVLAVASRGVDVTDECLGRCVALGHMLELALANWAAHEQLALHAMAEERRRIARELHDGLAHELAFIASKTHRSPSADFAPVDLHELAGAADRALDEARRAITVLSTSRHQPLEIALAQTAEDLGARLGVAVALDLARGIDVPGEVTENLLRIVREAITNAAVHGGPNRVVVRLSAQDGVKLVVEDDGCGFDTRLAERSGGFGLLSMKERAASIGARFSVESSPARGTRVEVVVP
jgi:signal transduction histidine kinase